jgi:secretion/DNA translocation related CpaE-like protein
VNAVVGVLGGRGGVGASTFAAVLAALAGRTGGALLIDLDAAGGGIDVALGIESVPGARWSGLHVAGGHLDPADLLAGLPRWGPCSVLAADLPELDAEAVLQVLAAASAAAPVVLDLPRAPCAERAAGLLRCDLVVVVSRADVGGLVGAHAVASSLPEVPVGLVLRRGAVASASAAELVGLPLLGEIRGGGAPLDPRRLPRGLARVAGGVLDGLPVRTGGGEQLRVPPELSARHAATVGA